MAHVKKRKRKPSHSLEEVSDDSGDDASSRFSNFFSQPAGKLSQLALAGLSESDPDPKLTIQNFPHRGFSRESVEAEEKPDPDGEQERKSRPRDDDPKGHLDVLLHSIEQFMDRGEISKAARAYGLVLQLRPQSRPIDIRMYNLWAIGAEILMRQGEDRQRQRNKQAMNSNLSDEAADHLNGGDVGNASRMPTPRWGSAVNLTKVKAYFETLIRQHPYDHRFPDRISATDFWLAMLSCEVYNAHAEYSAGLARIDEQTGDWDDDYAQEDETRLPYPEDDESFNNTNHRFGAGSSPKAQDELQGERLKKRRDEVRKRVLEAMRDITQRMEKLMEQPPYSRSGHFLRLRAVASLFTTDLCIPLSDTSPLQRREAETRRALEQRVARTAIQELVNHGSDTDTFPHTMFDLYLLQRKGLTNSPAHLYSSLPIRKV